ncbi:MAG: hypothetical protein J5I94_06000 [Phaeodactylibacter sp.]|nr:hypothetical protein [Phaeodactylibacter sp.]
MNTLNTAARAVLILLLLFPACLLAQSDVDVIYLKNGSTFEGKILEYQQGSTLRLQLRSGGEIEFREEEIRRIEQGWEPEAEVEDIPRIEPEKKKAYAFKEKGMYNATYFSTLSGSANGVFQLGLGIHNVTGYQFHRLFGLGAGFGVDTYSFDEGETLYPVFAEARGYLSRKRVAPYYSGNLGYGFAFKNRDELINKAEGGIFFRAALGLRLGADEGTNVLVDLGYQYQEAYFERRTPFQNEIEEKRLEFNRIVIRIGLIF